VRIASVSRVRGIIDTSGRGRSWRILEMIILVSGLLIEINIGAIS
jgi:hypothetical protein